MKNEFKRILIKRGFEQKIAEMGAIIIADNSLDGVYSHGLNKFTTIVKDIDEGALSQI